MTKEELEELKSKRTPTEVFARCVGYIRPTFSFNEGKLQEFKDRVVFKI